MNLTVTGIICLIYVHIDENIKKDFPYNRSIDRQTCQKIQNIGEEKGKAKGYKDLLGNTMKA